MFPHCTKTTINYQKYEKMTETCYKMTLKKIHLQLKMPKMAKNAK